MGQLQAEEQGNEKLPEKMKERCSDIGSPHGQAYSRQKGHLTLALCLARTNMLTVVP